jgi:hypothetical protein
VPELHAPFPLHDGQGTPDQQMGARASDRGGAGQIARRISADDDPTLNRRAPLRHDQGLDGLNPFPDTAAEECPNGMALNVLAYNIKRLVSLVGIRKLMMEIPS